MPTTEKQREYQRQRYRERFQKGFCCYCDEPREGSHVRCAIHREITADYCAGRRDIWKVKGLCAECGKNPPRPGRASCQGCADRWKTHRRNIKPAAR